MIGTLADEVGAGATSAPQGRSRGHGFCYAPISKELLSDSEVLVSARFFSLRYLLLYEHTSYTCFAGGGFHGGLAPVAPFRDPLPPPIICCVLLLVGFLSCSSSLGSCAVVGGRSSHPTRLCPSKYFFKSQLVAFPCHSRFSFALVICDSPILCFCFCTRGPSE